MQKLLKFEKILSILYLIFIAASIFLSIQLPSFQDLYWGGNEHCYWTNAMIGFVECGPDVNAYGLRSFFYNFWTLFIYAPMFAIFGSIKFLGITILIYTPLALLIFQGIGSLKRYLKRGG